jgi:hypothetical protein
MTYRWPRRPALEVSGERRDPDRPGSKPAVLFYAPLALYAIDVMVGRGELATKVAVKDPEEGAQREIAAGWSQF